MTDQLTPQELASLRKLLKKASPNLSATFERELGAEFADDPIEPTLKGWPVYTLADAYKPRTPLSYAVHGLFPLPSLSVVYGAPGTFKSMILMDMAACVSAGIPWLSPLPGKEEQAAIGTTQNPVLWCDFDNGKRRTDERMEAIGRARGLPADTPFYYISMPEPWLDLADSLVVPNMVDRITGLAAGLVIVDNLGTVMGKADENSADMAKILSACRRITELTGAALVLIHHQRKVTGISARSGETLRGHSSIEAALDLALLVEREEHSDTVQMKSTKTRGVDVLPFGAMFTYTHKTKTTELAEAQFWGVPVEDLVSDAAIERTILESFDSEHANKGDLAKTVKENLPDVGVNRIRNKIDFLAARGELVLTIGERGAKLYSLPTT